MLVVSSQGDSTFVIFELPTLSYRLKFAIQSSKVGAIDGDTDADGLAASGRNILGFPLGLLVVQDGSNTRPKENQNFKVIDWRDIDDLLVSMEVCRRVVFIGLSLACVFLPATAASQEAQEVEEIVVYGSRATEYKIVILLSHSNFQACL